MRSTGRNPRPKQEDSRPNRGDARAEQGPAALRLRRVVGAALRKSGVLDGSTILVGVSGGPDSMALLSVLSSLRKASRLGIVACIVDHGIRSRAEVNGDVEFVRGVCDSLGVPLEVVRIADGECVGKSRGQRRSLEEVAREIRHAALADRAGAVGACRVALGHTADDAAETVLMRVLQGSGVPGLTGIRASRGMIVRPLLEVTRADVLAYLEESGIDFRTDTTNLDDRILRNRIRRSLVPTLERVVPGFSAGLRMLSRKLSLVEDLLQKESARLPWSRTTLGFVMPAEAFFEAYPAVRAASLLTLYDQMRGRGSPRQLPYAFLQPVLGSDRPRGQGAILAGHGVRLALTGPMLAWEVCASPTGVCASPTRGSIVRPEKIGYFMVAHGSGSFQIRGTGYFVKMRSASGPRVIVGGSAIELLEHRIAPPLVLMSRRKGDVIRLESGTKSLKQLFIDLKVPEKERWKIPILADRKGVVAVLGQAAGYPNLVRKDAVASREEPGARRIAVSVERDTEGRET